MTVMKSGTACPFGIEEEGFGRLSIGTRCQRCDAFVSLHIIRKHKNGLRYTDYVLCGLKEKIKKRIFS